MRKQWKLQWRVNVGLGKLREQLDGGFLAFARDGRGNTSKQNKLAIGAWHSWLYYLLSSKMNKNWIFVGKSHECANSLIEHWKTCVTMIHGAFCLSSPLICICLSFFLHKVPPSSALVFFSQRRHSWSWWQRDKNLGNDMLCSRIPCVLNPCAN